MNDTYSGPVAPGAGPDTARTLTGAPGRPGTNAAVAAEGALVPTPLVAVTLHV
ncbi:MAG TPA: hypothetical protein VL769_03540 [Acidimicrobiia bacterium]|nr:hypothetical protein [Acidimicrobiia bacterium]